MAKTKGPTPQELYKARVEREKQEKSSHLPPGLVNHGNTCFMNSVLQGLIATRLLKDLVLFRPLPNERRIAAWRSPQLTNAHGKGGPFERPYTSQMPIGDVFISLVLRAWESQDSQRRESLTPKALLTAVGKKYDQYLDFAQQDAHEFLRILLDAMRMEEQDVIKKRQPPPPHTKKKQNAIPEEERLMSFSDMVFDGKLTSILVCQKCKHISQTYEDFNDLSLSIKPEDYVRERKRDRFKNLAKRLRSLPASAASSSTNGLIPSQIAIPAVEMQRSSSVPPTPNTELADINEPPFPSERRRSVDIIPPDSASTVAVDPPSPDPAVESSQESPGVVSSPDDKHVEFSDVKDKDKSKAKDGWGKLGRRISVTMGLGVGKPPRKSRDRTSKDLREPPLPSRENGVASAPPPESVPQIILSRPGTPTGASRTGTPISSRPQSVSPAGSSSNVPTMSSTKPEKRSSSKPPKPSSSSKSKSKSPKPLPPEMEYLRRVLADVVTPSSTTNFPMLRISPGGSSSSHDQWLKMGGVALPNVEECLKMFTAVEVLDGENAVGCRRCWKIENGLLPGPNASSSGTRAKVDGNALEDDSDEEDEHEHESEDVPGTTSTRAEAGSSIVAPRPIPVSASASFSGLSNGHRTSGSISDGTSFTSSSLSTLESTDATTEPSDSDGEMGYSAKTKQIPSISTTSPSQEPEPETDTPPTTARPSHQRFPAEQLHYADPDATIRRRVNGSGSLAIPSSSRRRVDSETSSVSSSGTMTTLTTTDDEEDVDVSESEVSAASSSARPSLSSDQGGARPSSSSSHPPTRKKTKKPKPVVMSPAYKRYLVDEPPPVLVVHLKRFQQTAKGNSYSASTTKKIDDFVAFSERLDLRPFLAPRREEFGIHTHPRSKGKRRREEDRVMGKEEIERRRREREDRCEYRLYAVVVHIGNMLGGHYVAYVALPPTDSEPPDDETTSSTTSPGKQPPEQKRQWAYISDTVVRLASLEEVLKAKAYICFYERM